MRSIFTFLFLFVFFLAGYDYFFNNQKLISTVLVSIDPDKQEIDTNAKIFMQAIFDNKYEDAKQLTILRDMDENTVKENFGGLFKIGLGLQSGLTQVFTGVETQYIYSVNKIDVLNDHQARIEIKITSNLDKEEELYLPMTMIKENGTWKVDYTSFVTGF
jgi:hypothetical protein